ncbi:type I restriction enzyme endonuclease domain-containing protein [Pantoea ananatis]
MRFLAAVAAMSQAFALATPHDKAMEAAPEVAFFQAVKARLNKFTENPDGSEEEHIHSLEVRVKTDYRSGTGYR